MQKYVITDKDGFTPEKYQFKPGKIVYSTKESSTDPVKAIIENSAYDDPLLAVLRCQNSTDFETKMFLLQMWEINLDQNNPQAYVIVKNEPMPAISLNDKFTFAMSVIKDIYNMDKVTEWVDNWLSNADRSLKSIYEIKSTLEREAGNNQALAKLSQNFAAAGSSAQIDELDDLIVRTLHLTSAAKESISPEINRDFIEKDITIALLDIEKYSERTDLIKIAKETVELSHNNVVAISESIQKSA